MRKLTRISHVVAMLDQSSGFCGWYPPSAFDIDCAEIDIYCIHDPSKESQKITRGHLSKYDHVCSMRALPGMHEQPCMIAIKAPTPCWGAGRQHDGATCRVLQCHSLCLQIAASHSASLCVCVRACVQIHSHTLPCSKKMRSTVYACVQAATCT